jgi:hypothetical protein
LPRHIAACLRRSQRIPTDACPSELLPPEKRSSRHREPLPPCRSTATPLRLRGLVTLGNPLRRRFVAEPHRPMLSWASPPGAPPRRASPTRPRTDDARAHQGSARAQTEPVAKSAKATPPQPEGRDHADCTGKERSGSHHCDASIPGKLRPSAPPPERCPRRSAPGTTVVVLGRPRGAPRGHRMIVGTTRPRARAPHGHPSCPWSLVPRGFDRRSDRPRLLHCVP